jgi:hypothetical protein
LVEHEKVVLTGNADVPDKVKELYGETGKDKSGAKPKQVEKKWGGPDGL